MSISFLTPSRTVLLIGDEALYIYSVSHNSARLVDTVPWQTDNFDETVTNLIQKDCGGKPVLILNDMTDQHFKGGQRLPKVGMLDKSSVLSRKLQVAFPTYPIRGALQTKLPKAVDQSAADKKQGAIYLFAAVPASEPVVKTMEVVKKSLSSVAGFFLLPVEVSDLVRELSIRLAGKSRPVSRWVVFIGQHHKGALRQVITRDGQLAMTRMTPVTDTDTDHDIWAQEVNQEFKATLGYLSRFGFTPDDGVDVIIVCNPKAGLILEKLIEIPCHYSTFTAPEAARELGINIGRQDDSRYADALHAAWVGRKSRFTLPMEAKDLSKIDKPRKIAALAMLLMFLGGGYLSWQLVTEFQKMNEKSETITNQQRSLAQATTVYNAEVAKMDALGFDIKLLRGAVKVFKDLETKRMHELVMIKRIKGALGNELRLDNLDIDVIPPPAPKPGMITPKGGELKPNMKASFVLSFPSSIEPEFGVREVNNLKSRLQTALPSCAVTIEKNVAGMEFKDTFKGEANESDKPKVDQQYFAKINIEGSL